MRLDDVTVQGGKGSQRTLPPECGCRTSRPASMATTCGQCGGRVPRAEAARAAPTEGRRLQDFLSAFV